MNTIFLKKLKKAISLTTLFVLLFSILNPFSNNVFAATIPSASIVSNNIYSWSLLKYWDNATLTFAWSESLTWVTVTFNWTPALSVTWSWSSWTSTSQNIVSWTWSINFTIDYSDLLWNTWATVTSTTDSSAVTIDAINPTASVDYSTTLPTTWNVIATLTWASENIVVTNNSWSLSYTFTSNWSFTFDFRDSAWNTWSTVATVANIDVTTPSIPTILTLPQIINASNINITWTWDIDEFVAIYSGTTVLGTWTIDWSWDFSVNTPLTEWLNTLTAKSFDSWWNYSLDSNSVVITRDTISPIITSKEIKNIKETSADLSVTFNDANFSSGSWVVEVTWWSFTWSYNLNFSWNVWTTSITWLTSDSSYTYTLNLTDNVWNTTNAAGSFSTAKAVTVVWSTTETWAISFGFASDLAVGGTYILTWSLLINSDLNDSNSLTGSLTLSWITIVVWSWSWDWILIPPTLVEDWSDKAATSSEIWPWVTIIETIKTWSELAELTSSWWYFDVSFIVPWYSSWTILSLYRSENWSTWVLNTPDSNCTLNASSMCTFRTDHLSYFALWLDSAPDAFSFTSVTSWELNTIYESNAITVSWMSTWATITVTWWEYKIWAWSYTSWTWTVNNGDTVTLRLTSSSSYSTLTTATLTIGWVSAWFSVTTKASSSWWWSGWGWGGSGWGWGSSSSTTKDTCPNWDYSWSLYDKICWTKPASWTWNTDDDWDNWTWGNWSSGNWSWGDWTGNSNSFTDIENSFAKTYIERLYDMWIVVWYSDWTFKPNNPITRAEFLGIAMKTLEIDLTSAWTNTFTDINAYDWVNAYAIKAKEMWVIVWYSDGTFRPNNKITRAEALWILFKLAEINLTSQNSLEYKDNDIQNWMTPYLIKARELWVANGQIINWNLMFRPNDPITRAEGSTIIVKTIDL